MNREDIRQIGENGFETRELDKRKARAIKLSVTTCSVVHTKNTTMMGAMNRRTTMSTCASHAFPHAVLLV